MTAFTMYTTPWCGYCHRLKSQLDREGIAFDIVPTLVYSDGTAHTNPSLAQVKQKLESLAS